MIFVCALIYPLLDSTAQLTLSQPVEYYDSEKWPEYRIRLTREGSLDELFQAGLRPGLYPGFERSDLGFKHANITFMLDDGETLPTFATEYGRILVKPSGILTMEFISQLMDTQRAREEMLLWLEFFRDYNEGMIASLDEFLEIVDDQPFRFDDKDHGRAPQGFGGGFQDATDIGYGVRFFKAYNQEAPLRMRLLVNWHRVRSRAEQREIFPGEVLAPEGYEITRMENFGPDSAVETLLARKIMSGKADAADSTKDPGDESVREQSEKADAVVASETREKQNHTTAFRTLAAILILLCLFTFGTKIFRKA